MNCANASNYDWIRTPLCLYFSLVDSPRPRARVPVAGLSTTQPLHLLAPRLTSQLKQPFPRGVMTRRPWRKGASVRAWQSRHRAISRSLSKSEPPCVRLTT